MTHPTALMCDSFITLRTVSETFSRSQAGTSFNITASDCHHFQTSCYHLFIRYFLLAKVRNVRSADQNDETGSKHESSLAVNHCTFFFPKCSEGNWKGRDFTSLLPHLIDDAR